MVKESKSESKSKSKNSRRGLITGISIGSVVIAVVITLGILYFFTDVFKKKSAPPSQRPPNVHGYINTGGGINKNTSKDVGPGGEEQPEENIEYGWGCPEQSQVSVIAINDCVFKPGGVYHTQQECNRKTRRCSKR